MAENQAEFEAMALDPARAFDDPEAVLSRDDLSPAQKIEILRRWEYDARELEVAEEEGMTGPKDGLLARIHAALASLGAPADLEHEPPTKQGGV